MTAAEVTAEADLVVLGGGMAGLTAGAFAARRGRRVLLVEKAPQIGGSAVLSSGYVWTAPSMAALRERAPRGSVALGEVLLEEFPATIEFIRSSGVWMSEEVTVLGFGRGHRIDVLAYLRRCVSIIENAGGHVVLAARTVTLRQREGCVIGVSLLENGAEVEVTAPATILATGGFQGDRALVAEAMGQQAPDRLLLRANPYSTGDALRLARAIGAATAGDMDCFYGHLVVSPLASFTQPDFARLAAYCSDRCLLFNIAGKRFTDESAGDFANAQQVLRQEQGRAVMIMSNTVRHTAAVAPAVPGLEAIDLIREATAAGARVCSARRLDELVGQIESWQFRAQPIGDALRARPDPLDPPLFALEVRPAITFTQGGLAVDRDAAVLDTSGVQIDGLYAAGADVGGVYQGGYAGGLSLAGGFGLRAVRSVTG
ncbi:FAD-dependent oxidoreductase [Actinophytocola sp.]|uniref:FAD-dependent oxidoreductase n=1 Tax=Actinophytocola sp. TaxID=1872138 RepID=UPI003D6A4798